MRSAMSRPRTGSVAAASAVLWLAGCFGGDDGPELGDVSGTVTLDGEPLAGATVTFTPVETDIGGPSIAQTDEDGYYELRFSISKFGAAVGEHVVQITTAGITEDADGNEVETPERVPARYNVQSELRYTVESGDNQIDILLESDEEAAPPADVEAEPSDGLFEF